MRTKFASSGNRRKKCFIHAGCSCIIRRMQDVLLVLETSCVQSSVAAWSGESLLCQAAWRAERNHSSAIFKAVRQVLDALEGRRLKEIVVGSGPGAYGGIRVALAVADGLSLVHGSRVAAFSSWNGLGLHHGEACVMSDARRGGWTWGRLENGVLTDVPAVLPAEQARACVAECMGKGVPVFPRKRRIIWPPGKCRGLSPCILLQRRSGPCGCPWRRPAEKNFWKVRRNRCM